MKLLSLGADQDTARNLERNVPDCTVQTADRQAEALRLVAAGGWDLILLDSGFAGSGFEILSRLHDDPTVTAPVVLLAESPSMELTLEAFRRGARDVLHRRPSPGRIQAILQTLKESGRDRPLPLAPAGGDVFVGSSPEMLDIYKTVARAASSDATVLVLGESGTGKEMIARTLHSGSARADGPFVAVNCAAVPDNLLESELFGHEKGAFTGAVARRLGLFERATNGTLFLDEVGDMSLALQSKILRALQEREIERVGGESVIPIDVRIVAATHQDLTDAVREGRFREDLFYRLAVVTLRLPPLRARGSDLNLLVEHFAAQYAHEYSRPIRAVSEDALRLLRAYPWPGNVRQLSNAIERAVVLADGEVLLARHLPPEIASPSEGLAGADEAAPYTLKEMERCWIRRALRDAGDNLTAAAERLGIHRNTLRRKIVEHQLSES